MTKKKKQKFCGTYLYRPNDKKEFKNVFVFYVCIA